MNQILKTIGIIFIFAIVAFGFDGFVNNFYRVTPSDVITPSGPVEASTYGNTFNGLTFDRLRGNTELTLLPPAARTVTTHSADFINYNGKGAQVILNITVASGTGGLQATLQGKDPISGTYYNLTALPTAVVATGIKVYELFPGASTAGAGDITVRTAGVLPRTFRINVTAGDTSSYTYSVGEVVIN